MPSELEIISWIRKHSRASSGVKVGIGDDAAVIETGGAGDWIVCSDLMVEGVHFRSEWAAPRLIGRKALAVTLSDVAAMGGAARFALASIALPGGLSAQLIEELFHGMFELADDYGVSIIGGDTSSSRDSLFIDTVAIGECARGGAVTRSGAQVGDIIYVTGKLGASALGLALLERGYRLEEKNRDDARQRAIRKHLDPEPLLKAGRAIGEAHLATAMIDISDGLSTDLSHILEESRCGAIVHASAIPVARCALELSVGIGLDAFNLALHGGEEYELLFTARPENQNRVAELSNAIGMMITAIGEITDGKGLQLEHSGRIERLSPSGYEHRIGNDER
ncbi:MAG TPA: thiamine-phosphate kinase [Blastocatellia bacterium]|jgi:thiamine-monophosphate kinase|nr:thiamine-phosphate kinase [Blastocatellia bacterium]